jgi:hypothetical protein
MLYVVCHRPRNIGAGWKKLRTVEARSPLQAIERECFPHWNELGFANQQNCDGTPSKPYTGNGIASELMAIPESEYQERLKLILRENYPD